MTGSAARIMIGGLALSGLPWLAGPGGFETTKLLWLAVTLLGVLLAVRGRLQIREPALSGLIVSALAYLAIRGTVTDATATAWLGTLVNPLGVAGWWVIGGLVLIVINYEWPPETADLIRKLVIVGGLLLGLAALVQGRSGFGIDWQTYDDPGRGRFIFGTIGTPGQLGVVAALLASILIEPLRRQSTIVTKATIIALAAVVVTSGSITGFILLVLAFVWHWLARSWRRTFVMIVSALALTVFLVGSANSALLNRWPSLADRAVIWRSAWQAAVEAPWFGYGPNHFQVAYDRHYPDRRLAARAITEERAHNWPLEIQVELGLVGLVLVGLVLYQLRRRLRWADHWLTAWLWLLTAMFNPVIAPVAAIGVLLLIQPSTKTKPAAKTTSLSPGIRMALIGLALGLVWINLTPVRATLIADRANAYSVRGEFTAAAAATSRYFNVWPAHPQLYLIAAEAATNSALKQDLWLESDLPALWLERATRQLPGANSAATAAKIGRRWQEHGAPQPIWVKAQFDFLKGWSDHPRHQELVRSLRL